MEMAAEATLSRMVDNRFPLQPKSNVSKKAS